MIKEAQTTSKHYKRLTELLGEKYVKNKISSPFDFIEIANKGVNANAIKNFRTYFNLPRTSTANMLNISEPTLYRWIRANKNLDRNSSVKLFEMADLFLYGSEVFESKENFLKWMKLPNLALGGMEPMELVEIPGGITKVSDVLGRIEHGIFS